MEPTRMFLQRVPVDIRLQVFDNVFCVAAERRCVLNCTDALLEEANRVDRNTTPSMKPFIGQRNKKTTISLDRIFGLTQRLHHLDAGDLESMVGLSDAMLELVNEMGCNNMEYRVIFSRVVMAQLALGSLIRVVNDRRNIEKDVANRCGMTTCGELVTHLEEMEMAAAEERVIENGYNYLPNTPPPSPPRPVRLASIPEGMLMATQERVGRKRKAPVDV